MTIFNLYVFDRSGNCLYYQEWHRKRPAASLVQEQKLVFGLVFILKQFTQKLSPKQPSEGFQSLTTSSYKLYHIETPTGFRFVMTSDPATGDLRDLLRRIYADYFVDMVLKNPAYTPGQPFKSEAFGSAVDRFLRTLPYFA